MLSGIKTGKRKHKVSSQSLPEATAAVTSKNQSVADQLRKSLLADVTPTAPKSHHGGLLPHESLEKSGRIGRQVLLNDTNTTSDENGKMTVAMLPEKMSLDEEMTRNVMRVGKKRRQKRNSAGIDSDDEEERLASMMLPDVRPEDKIKSKAKQEQNERKAQQRTTSRQLALQDKQDHAISACWWWLESKSFSKHRLLSLGDHVSLVMAPLNKSLTPGRHFYLVPIQHAESLAGCDENVWEELQRFQQSLRALFDKEYHCGVIFTETVLSTNQFWQARMEVIPVKRRKWQDAELFFRSALTVQADEMHGTHTKLLSTKGKGLRRTVPKHFPYFYVEWDAPDCGLAQIVENKQFPPDFAADTIAGMTGADPIRFLRNKKFSNDEEKQYIMAFLEKWKSYDWTDQLDA